MLALKLLKTGNSSRDTVKEIQHIRLFTVTNADCIGYSVQGDIVLSQIGRHSCQTAFRYNVLRLWSGNN